MKWIYIVSWCILTVAPNTPKTDKFGRTSMEMTSELNYITSAHEKKFAFREDAIKFINEAKAESNITDVRLDSCTRMMQIIYGDTVWVDCFEFDHSDFYINTPYITR